MKPLTGQTIYESDHDWHNKEWTDLRPEQRQRFDNVAIELEKTLHYDELIALVKDYYDVALIGAQMEDPTFYDQRYYEDRMKSLQERTEQLLGATLEGAIHDSH